MRQTLSSISDKAEFLESRGYRKLRAPWGAGLKRVGDVVISAIGLAGSLLLWPFIAAAVKLNSKGPVFYVQERVGRNGRPFRLLKFRSMIDSAENGEPLWAEENDVRVTAVGKVLRRVHLDELPQLWNILRGDMSLVGPRPERPEFVAELAGRISFYELRHVVKPGLTGWAQVNYKYAASLESSRIKLGYDLFYISRWSPVLDAKILVRTVGKVFEKEHVA
jgi:lipopolysaccharide/colanic/teichoic acid biosynthesis glycosyltransferase